MRDYPGLRFVAVYVAVASLLLVLLSLLIPWMESPFVCTCSDVHSTGWELVKYSEGPGSNEVNLTVAVDENTVFTGLAFIILSPVILLAAILVGIFAGRKSAFLELIFLLVSAILMLASINNLWAISNAQSIKADVGLYVNALGSLICLSGAAFAIVYRLRRKPEPVQVPVENVEKED